MAEKSIIKEFLVSLGYTIDENSQKKFDNSLKGAVLQANLLSEAITDMARVVVEGVQKVAQSFDGLYWASQRTGTSVQNIRALSYAVSQLGGTYDGARNAIEAFGQHLRSNPGYVSLLNGLGIKTSENGKMRDQVEILEDLGKALNKRSYPVALQYANALGIDENTMRALMSGDLQKNIQEYSDLQKSLGFNNEKAAESAKQFMQAMREAQITIETVVAKILTDLEPELSKVMKSFADWVADHGPQIEQAIREIGNVVVQLSADFETLVKDLKPAWEGFDHLTQSIAGKDGLVAAIELLVGGLVLGKLLRMLSQLTGIGGASGGSLLAVLARVFGVGAAAYALTDTAQAPDMASIREAEKGAWYNGLWGKTKRLLGFGGGAAGSSDFLTANTPGNSERDANALESYKFWRSKGLTRNQALGLLGNEQGESDFNPHATGDGGAAGGSMQWHKTRRDQILNGTGIDVYSKDTTHQQMLEASWWEYNNTYKGALTAIKNAQTPQEAAGAAVNYYELPLDKAGASYTRGIYANRWAGKINEIPRPDPFRYMGGPNAAADNAGASIHQTTHITVNGSTDPHATANAVADKQNNVNTTMQRNLQGAVR